MVRKFIAVLAALMFVVGGLFAEEIKGIFKKCEGGKICVEVDGKVKEFKVAENFKTKKGEIPSAKVLGKFKEGDSITVYTEGDTVVKAGKGKKK